MKIQEQVLNQLALAPASDSSVAAQLGLSTPQVRWARQKLVRRGQVESAGPSIGPRMWQKTESAQS